jgi:uncharacterized protein YbjT (DUF2867 family)
MILIAGSTGKTGSALTKLLASRGVPVRAMVHSPGKAGELPPGVDFVTGDFDEPLVLQWAMDDVDHAYLTTPPGERALEWQTNFIHAAKQAGVQHVVKLSMLGADPGSESRFQRMHAEGEKALEDSGIGWTHLRPNFFMQTVLQYLQGDAFYAMSGEGGISTVDVRDVAHVAAAALTEPGHEGRAYDITGPEALTYAEMAALLPAALGRPISIVNLSFDQAREVMTAAGFPAWNLEGVIELNRWFQSGAAALVTDVVREVGKQEPRTFQQFLMQAK